MKTPIALFLLIASGLPVSDAIAKKPKFDPQQLVDQIKESTPKNQYLMAEPTDDPSPWIGRFIPDNVAGPDESAAQKTRCSEFLQRNIVTKSAFGTMETTMSASKAASATIGIGNFGTGIDWGPSASSYVQATKTKRMFADPSTEDLEGLEACCNAHPDSCTKRYVTEFIEGTDISFFAAAGNGRSVGVRTPNAGVINAELIVANDVAWQRSMTIPNNAYFYFKVAPTPGVAGSVGVTQAGCGDGNWMKQPPRTTKGQYFVGVSEPVGNEVTARERAASNAREQVVKWLGESISTGSIEVRITSGSASRLASSLNNEETVRRAAAGVARLVKVENVCVKGTRDAAVRAYTLSFLPKESYQSAIEAMQE